MIKDDNSNALLNELMNKVGQTCLCSLGQAGFILKNKEGKTIVIDPYLSDSVEKFEGHMGFKRLLPKIIKAEQLNADIVITTHSHLDHFDTDSIFEIMNNKKTKLFASYNCCSYLKEQDFFVNRVEFVKPGEYRNLAGFEIAFIKCDHGEAALDAFGVIVKTDGIVICETGDTCLRINYKEEYLQFGNVDVLIAPINGKYGNMSEKDCVNLAELLRPKFTVPCHYGMFASHGGDVGLFYDLMKAKNLDLYLMTQGEIIEL